MMGIRGLRFSYGSSEVLKGIDLDVGEGITALLGPNGAGKSTLVKCIAGVNRPSAGSVVFDGRDILGGAGRVRMGYLAQDLPTVSDTNVLEMMLLGRVNSLGMTVTPEDIDMAYGALEAVGIGDLASRDFNDLSGGQRQTVMLAQCLVDDPELIVLDEPTNNLDIRRELDMFEVMSGVTRDRGLTTLMVLHDVNFASRFADRVCVMCRGEVHSFGTPEEVVTERMLREVYGVEARVGTNSFGTPAVEVIGSVR